MASSEKGLPDVPLRAKLSPKYKNTFAYPTIKDRCPVILCKIIDHLYRERIEIGLTYGKEAQEGLKLVVEQLSKLRYEMQTNKELIEITDNHDNSKVWNSYLTREKEEGEGVTWFTGSWMWVECYMYRRVFQSLFQINELRSFDFFRHQKEEGFRESLSSMKDLGDWLFHSLANLDHENKTEIRELFGNLLQISLWGNKCDLSISAGSKKSASGNAVDQLSVLRERIIVDQSSNVWESLEDSNQIIDMVLDNAGFELFTDLCLADFLIASKMARKIRFRMKNQPWFVSDTTPRDFIWTLNNLCGNDNAPALGKLGLKWKDYLESGLWELSADSFWTFPHVYSEMCSADPPLYSTLAEAKLVIFKGDLNYRKLVGDRNWETTVPFRTALQGFVPSNVLSLRTLKADVVTGLAKGQAEQLNLQDRDWMINGNWGLIQFAPA